MLPRHGAPLAPRHVARRGPPRPVFLAQLSQRSVGKSSPHEVIHMEHHICRIFILTCVRASSGCRQTLSRTYGQLRLRFHPRRQRGGQRARRAAEAGGRGCAPRAPVGPPSVLGRGGLGGAPCPCLPLCGHSCRAAARAVPCRLSQGPEDGNRVRYFNRKKLTQAAGGQGTDTGQGTDRKSKGRTHRSTPGAGLLEARSLAQEAPMELGARPQRKGVAGLGGRTPAHPGDTSTRPTLQGRPG